jgi:hypothetical protein
MAVGPEHALLSVNSSVAIYGKTGGNALLQRTLSVWFSNVVQGITIFDPKAFTISMPGAGCCSPWG